MKGLVNTKKLAVAGHTTLYNSGAFAIPETTIYIVPPVPGCLKLAAQIAGQHAGHFFAVSITRARKSLDFARAGVKKTRNLAVVIQQGSRDIANAARAATRFGAAKVSSTLQMIRKMVNEALSYSGKVFHSTMQSGVALAQGSLSAGEVISKRTRHASAKIWASTIYLARSTATTSRRAARRYVSSAREQFVKDYAALPAKLAGCIKNIAESVSLGKFFIAFQNANHKRAGRSRALFHLFINTSRSSHYTNGIKSSFQKASRELSEKHDTGYTFALLKSLRWVVQGILWDGAIKPVMILMSALLGFVIVNTVIFPVRLVVNEAVAVVLAVSQVISNSVVALYEMIAPSVAASAVGLFSAVVLVGGQVLAGTELIVGSIVTAGTFVLGKIFAALIAGGGYLAGKLVQYVGAPLLSLGLAVAGCMLGIVAGVVSVIIGSVIVIVGFAGEIITRLVGNIAAGGVLVGGVTASVMAGIALGAFELVKAILVPVSYELVAGFIIGYCLVMQLCAHAVLAVADVAYMLLSLEGPRWVLAAVTGNAR